MPPASVGLEGRIGSASLVFFLSAAFREAFCPIESAIDAGDGEAIQGEGCVDGVEQLCIRQWSGHFEQDRLFTCCDMPDPLAYADFARLAAATKFAAAGEWASLRYAIPTTKGGGAGVSGRTFNRGPLKQSKSW